jgi:purine-cytosine permease-like protein
MADSTPNWGIEPVPQRLWVLGMADTTLLWLNLGVSLLVLVLPAYFDLSLKDALAATLVGGLIGNAMLALAGLIGADGARARRWCSSGRPLGRHGSYVATVLNVLQCMGWAIFELIVIATAAASCATSSSASRRRGSGSSSSARRRSSSR